MLKLSEQKLEKGKERLDKYKLLNTTQNSSRLLANIKNKTSKTGIAIPVFDLFIASIAMDTGITLITLDGHFKKIPNFNSILI